MSLDTPGWKDFSSGNDNPVSQDLSVDCCFDNLTGTWSLTSETAGSISFVAPDGSFWCTSGQGSGFGGGPYPAGGSVLWKLWERGAGCGLNDISASKAPLLPGRTANVQASQAAQAGRSGHSDEKSYILTLSSVSPQWFSGGDSGVVYFGENSGAVPLLNNFNCSQIQAWTKHGSQIFQLLSCVGSGQLWLIRHPVPFADNYENAANQISSMTTSIPGSPFPGMINAATLRDLFANGSYLYGLIRGSEFANPKIVRVDKGTLAFIEDFDITDPDFVDAASMFVFDDDRIFILAGSGGDGNFTIGSFKPSTEMMTKIGSLGGTCTLSSNFHASNTTGFHFANNFFYIGDDGGRVISIPVCPFGS